MNYIQVSKWEVRISADVFADVHVLVAYRIFRCISRDFKTEKFAPKIDLDLYTDDNFKVSKMCADFLICCSNLQIIYP